MAKGFSVHIGVNDVDPAQYSGWSGGLRAAEADARAMEALASTNGFASRVLLVGPDATATAVAVALHDVAEAASPGDLVLLTFAGLGGLIRWAGDTKTGLAKTWVLYDRQMPEAELECALSKIRPQVRIVVVVDSSYTGTVVRALVMRDLVAPALLDGVDSGDSPRRERAMPAALSTRVYTERRVVYDEVLAATPSHPTIAASGIVLRAAQDSQLASESMAHGLFTEKLLEVWADGAFQGGYRNLWRKVMERMPSWQSPNLETIGDAAAAKGLMSQQPFKI